MQQPGDDFAHGAQLVGQGLVGGAQLAAVAQQGGGQAAVQLLEGNGFDQGSEVGHAGGKQAHHKIAEGLAGQGRAEEGGGQHAQPGGAGGDAACGEHLARKQAGR